jgi:hypothetical protein
VKDFQLFYYSVFLLVVVIFGDLSQVGTTIVIWGYGVLFAIEIAWFFYTRHKATKLREANA